MTDLPKLENGLTRFADVRAAGAEVTLREAVDDGAVERVRRGVYAATIPDTWRSAPERDERRYRRAVLAASMTLHRPVFTSFSGLVLHELPIYGRWPQELYVVSRDKRGRKRPGLISIAGSYDPETELIDGVATTSIEFTLIQVCRHATLAAALTAVDAALHQPRFGDDEPKTTIERLRAEHERLLPYPRSRRTEAVLARATPLADTPLETVSRLVIEELGFEKPDLQHELWLPELGRRAFLDFRWASVDAAAEADGRGKYRSGTPSEKRDAERSAVRRESAITTDAAASRAAEVAARAVISEKDRENAIRRQVRAFDRWDWAEMAAKRPVEQRLTAMGVPRPRGRRWLVGSPNDPAALPPARGTSRGRKVQRPEQAK